MKIRTDLAMEAESFTTATGKLQGIKVTEKKEDDITITRMDILNHTQRKLKLLLRLMIRKLLLLHLRLLLQKSIKLVQRVYSTRIMLQERFLV